MWGLSCIVAIYCTFIFNQLGFVDTDTLTIPLLRQKSPRQNALTSKKVHTGISFDWFTKPHKHNNTNDSVALWRYLDNEFYGKVLIGHKGKTLNVVFDTAWSKSWVISSDCSWKTIGCWFHNKYDHTESSTYIANGKPFVANEGSYNLSGYYSNDTFSISHSRVDGQMFIEMTSIPPMFIYNKADGVMGLGFKTDDYNPFFYNLLEQKRIKRKLFSVYLNRDPQSLRGGNLILGQVDPKHIHQVPNPDDPKNPLFENITYLPVDSSLGDWTFKLDRIELVNKNKSYSFCSSGCEAFPDTSSTTITGPKDEIEALHVQMKAKLMFFGLYKVNCDTVKSLPHISFIMAGKNFTIKGDQYTQKLSYGPVTFCISAFRANTFQFAEKSWMLGGAFLSEFYSIYDLENSRIGFVRSA